MTINLSTANEFIARHFGVIAVKLVTLDDADEFHRVFRIGCITRRFKPSGPTLVIPLVQIEQKCITVARGQK